MAGDALSRDAAGAAAEANTDGGSAAPLWTRRRVRRLASWAVLALGGLITALLLMLLIACFINDRTIENSRGTAVAEVVDTSLTRTAVRFDTESGRVFNPPGGVLYPSRLKEGQLVRVEYNQENPDLVRVEGRDVSVALLPVFSAAAVLWAVLLPVFWLLRRAAARTGEPTRI